MDILFVEPNASITYQKLANAFSAIETPTWNLLLAGSLRSAGLSVGILDANAEGLNPKQASERITNINPKVVVFSCYGQNPNSSTPFFGCGLAIAETLRNVFDGLIGFVGPHVAALPIETIQKHYAIDFVLCNEGVYQLLNIFENNLNLKNIKGIAYRLKNIPLINQAEKTVSQVDFEKIYTGYAWDLLPFDKKPLDLYRSHLWHSDFGNKVRTPFAAIYTSLGCSFRCSFCMINMINRDSNDVEATSSNFPKMRYFSASWLEKEFDWLKSVGVETLRISDEMFYLNREHYKPILDLFKDKNYQFNMWAYSRVDTIRPEYLKEFKESGINWLCLGIEAGDDEVRRGAFKGKFLSDKVASNVKLIKEAGIKVLANFIVGLPEDTEETISTTLRLAKELQPEYVNFYPCMALPGSDLYLDALKKGIKLPENYEGYAFLSKDCIPMPTNYLTSAEVLRLRDHCFYEFVSDREYQSYFKRTFGPKALDVLNKMATIKLERKLLSQ